MRKLLYSLFVATLSFTSAAQAFDLSRPAIFNEVSAQIVENTDADLLTVKVSGLVRNGLSRCESAFHRAGIKTVEENGHVVIKATLAPVMGLALTCDGGWDDGWKGSAVSETIQLTPAQLDAATVANVGRKGESLSLKSLIEVQDQE